MSSKDNNEFVWTNQLVKEFAEKWHGHKHSENMLQSSLEEFIQSKQKRGWEITSFDVGGSIYTLMEWQKIKCYSEPTFEAPGSQISQSYAFEKGFKIHSVRRISDGEVFSVGDEVIWDWELALYNSFKINEFRIIEDGSLQMGVANGAEQDFDTVIQFNLKKAPAPVKKVLFTTEDGVDIFGHYFKDGEMISWVWSVHTYMWYFEKCFLHQYQKDASKAGILKYFSTKEKAEEYVIMNRPVLSVNDVLDNLKYDLSFVNKSSFEETLKQLAKSKIDSNGTK